MLGLMAEAAAEGIALKGVHDIEEADISVEVDEVIEYVERITYLFGKEKGVLVTDGYWTFAEKEFKKIRIYNTREAL